MATARSIVPYWFGGFLMFRIIQRIYFVFKSRSHIDPHEWDEMSVYERIGCIGSNYLDSFTFRPRERLERFLSHNKISVTNHTILSRVDGTKLRYRRLGTGKKYVLLANGVGTDLYMWLPVLQYLFELKGDFFQDYTLIVQTYRGLFGKEDDSEPTAGMRHQAVEVTIDNCVEDVQDMMKHAGVIKYQCIIGWSTGAQVALACCAKYPQICDTLYLMSPSAGDTLHTFGQFILPLPLFLQKHISVLLSKAFLSVVPLVDTSVWDVWGYVCNQTHVYSVAFGILAFFCGFPPEMAVYFDEYNREIFTSRTHTASLIKLIVSLDEPVPFVDVRKVVENVRKVVILSGFFDFMTGVYLSHDLADVMNSTESVGCGGSADKSSVGSEKDSHGKNISCTTKHTANIGAQSQKEGLFAHTGKKCDLEVFTMGSHFLLLEWPEIAASILTDLLITCEED